ncbi:MAG TPA: hypothetical protein VF610_04425 [Segetibacter sp.]
MTQQKLMKDEKLATKISAIFLLAASLFASFTVITNLPQIIIDV